MQTETNQMNYKPSSAVIFITNSLRAQQMELEEELGRVRTALRALIKEDTTTAPPSAQNPAPVTPTQPAVFATAGAAIRAAMDAMPGEFTHREILEWLAKHTTQKTNTGRVSVAFQEAKNAKRIRMVSARHGKQSATWTRIK